MINLLATSLYYSNTFNGFDIIIIIIFAIGIISACSSINDTPKSPPKRKTSYKVNYSNFDDEYSYQTDYDPTWDDAYFEKTGIDPWFDDNPWDHEKK